MTARRLFHAARLRICGRMPVLSLPTLSLSALLAVLLAVPAVAQNRPAVASDPAKPRTIGKFDDWQAVTHVEAGQTVCYAFTRAKSSSPALRGRGAVVLTVTHRQGLRDAVALAAGFAYAANAAVAVDVGANRYDFYTAQRSAFARDGAAAVTGMQRGSQAVARSPQGKGAPVVDSFSLKGFTAAYTAIGRACPAK